VILGIGDLYITMYRKYEFDGNRCIETCNSHKGITVILVSLSALPFYFDNSHYR
jgi:hypothetical protein